MRVITHDGLFHADEVMACAILRLAGCCALFEIIRSRKEAAVAGPEAILVDVGGIYDPQNCRYDHHQKEFSVCRENGIPLASAGLVWRDFYTRVFRQMEISHISGMISLMISTRKLRKSMPWIMGIVWRRRSGYRLSFLP